MPKKFGVAFVIMGAVLIILALLLFMYNKMEDRRAGQHAEVLVDDIHAVIHTEPVTEETTEPEPEETLPPELPVEIIDGYGYVGILNIPDLEIELPIMAEWDYTRLKIAPCRHVGSSRTDDLVISAHNYASHFGKLKTLEIGAEVIFTDMDGIVNRYVLERGPETLAPTAVDEVLNSGYDLVLYTCTPGGATRVVAFFNRVEEPMAVG